MYLSADLPVESSIEFDGLHIVQMDLMAQPDEVVSEFTHLTKAIIVVTYPLSKSYQVEVICQSFTGFTWGDFAREIQRAYQHVYAHADLYGVWGHHISDLYLEAIDIVRHQGQVYVRPIVGS